MYRRRCFISASSPLVNQPTNLLSPRLDPRMQLPPASGVDEVEYRYIYDTGCKTRNSINGHVVLQ